MSNKYRVVPKSFVYKFIPRSLPIEDSLNDELESDSDIKFMNIPSSPRSKKPIKSSELTESNETKIPRSNITIKQLAISISKLYNPEKRKQVVNIPIEIICNSRHYNQMTLQTELTNDPNVIRKKLLSLRREILKNKCFGCGEDINIVMKNKFEVDNDSDSDSDD